MVYGWDRIQLQQALWAIIRQTGFHGDVTIDFKEELNQVSFFPHFAAKSGLFIYVGAYHACFKSRSDILQHDSGSVALPYFGVSNLMAVEAVLARYKRTRLCS